MKDFFISYNSADKSWAEWIAWQLEEEGYTTILHAWDFRPGHNFMMEMDEASKKTERTIAVLSPDYFESDFCKLEAFSSLVEDPSSKEGRLLPVRVREFEGRGLMRSIVYIDLLGLDEEAAKNTLLGGVRFERVKPSTPPGFAGQPLSTTVKQVEGLELIKIYPRPKFEEHKDKVTDILERRLSDLTGRIEECRELIKETEKNYCVRRIHENGTNLKTLSTELSYC